MVIFDLLRNRFLTRRPPPPANSSIHCAYKASRTRGGASSAAGDPSAPILGARVARAQPLAVHRRQSGTAATAVSYSGPPGHWEDRDIGYIGLPPGSAGDGTGELGSPLVGYLDVCWNMYVKYVSCDVDRLSGRYTACKLCDTYVGCACYSFS